MMNLFDTFIHVIKMPHDIHGFSCPHIDGSFSIYLNAYDCRERQTQAYENEIKHIEDGDYAQCGIVVDMLEAERHR
jgi:hypothetical protein